MKYDFYIGIDVGIRGGITIIENGKIDVFCMPIMQKIVNKKKKNIYDLKKIVEILKPYSNKNVLCLVEIQSVRPGEGGVSAQSNGKGWGQLLGVTTALGFNVVEVSSQRWKKHFPQLNTPSIIAKKELMSELRKNAKLLKGKIEKKANTKELEKLSRQIKLEAKKAAIELVKKDYPDIDLVVKKTESDGLAESILIAKFGLENQDLLNIKE